MIIEVKENVFSHDWILNVYGERFYLGQDVKFCNRVLQMEPSYVVDCIGSRDLSKKSVRKRLAKFICEHLGINRKNVHDIEPWGLCCQ